MTRSDFEEQPQPVDITDELSSMAEALAEIEHERWAHWQSYVHSKGQRQDDGSLLLPPELVSRWDRLIATPFRDLTEAERSSDHEQVSRYLPLIRKVVETALRTPKN